MKKELILRNPLRLMGDETDDIIPEGGFGAVLARAGVGKTALLVQLAVNALLRGNNVLHISLNDPVKKVSLWYKEVFNHLTKPYIEKDVNIKTRIKIVTKIVFFMIILLIWLLFILFNPYFIYMFFVFNL